MELERKTFTGYEVKVLDEQQGIMEAIISVFNNVDYGGDIVRPGFFDKAAARKLPKGVWAHDPTLTIAKTLDTYPLLAGDPKLPEQIRHLGGQYVKTQFNLETQRGREAFSDVKGGYIDEFSFAYYVAPGGSKYMDNGTRELLTADSWPEWSPVLEGMNPATALISAKSADGTTNDDVPLSQDLNLWIASGERVAKRLHARGELLEKQGRVFSQANLEQMQSAMDILASLISKAITEVEAEEEPAEEAGKSQAEVLVLKLRLAEALLKVN